MTKPSLPEQPKKNAYTCEKCRFSIITVDVNTGVTPFMITCKGCEKAHARSAFYRIDQALTASHEWYMPTDLTGLKPGEVVHVQAGGLLLRQIDLGPEHTATKLAVALDKADLPEMARRARTGWYHDYLSPLALPCQALDTDLAAAATPAAIALRARHHNGDFDGSEAEDDAWANSAEGLAALSQLVSKNGRERLS